MPRARSVFAIGPLLIALLPQLFYLLVLAAYAGSLFRFPFDYDQGEGFELYDGLRLSRGENIYLDNAHFPFYSSNYPPLYRLMLVPFIWLMGPQIAVGRAVTFACTIVLAGMIYLAAARQSPQKWLGAWPTPLAARLLAVIVALSFLSSNYVYQIAPLARAHLPMVMFAFAGVALIERAFMRERVGASLFWGMCCLMLAGFTKLQAVDAMAAGFLYFLIRQPRNAVLSVLICAAMCGAAAAGLNALTTGQFWLNVVSANVNEYDISQTLYVYDQWWHLQGVMIVCSALFVLWDVARALHARSLKPITVWSLWAISGAAMGMLTGKWGAGPAYLIGGMAAQCVCMAGLIFRMAQWGRLHQGAFALAALALVAQAFLNFHTHTDGRFFGPATQAIARLMGREKFPTSYAPYSYYDSVGYTQLGHVLDKEDGPNAQKISDMMRTLPGPVLSEEAMFSLRAGKDVVSNPTQLYNLSMAEMLDTRELIERINRKEFSAVLFRAQFYPKDVLGAIGHNYRWPDKPIQLNGFNYWLLLPQ